MHGSLETLQFRPGGGGGLVSKTLNTKNTEEDMVNHTYEPVIQQTKMVKNVYRQLPVIKYPVNTNKRLR